MKSGAADLSSFEPLPACKEIHVFCNISKIPDSFFTKNNGSSAGIIDFHGYQYTDSDYYFGLPYNFTIRNLDGTNFTTGGTNFENSTNLKNVSKIGMDQSFTNCQILSMTDYSQTGKLDRLVLDNCVATFGNTKCCPEYTLHITNMKLKSSDVYFEMATGSDVLFENCELTMDSLSSNASNNAFLNAAICPKTIFRNCRIKYSSNSFSLVYANSGANVVIDNCIITNTGSYRPVLLKTPYTAGRVSQLEVTNSYLQKVSLVIGDYGDDPNYKVTWSQLVDCGFSSNNSKIQFCDFSTPFTVR